MKDRIRKYVDNLFSGIRDTRELRELKEEICANLLEKVNDYAASGEDEDAAFREAVSSLGDMSELIASLKKASEIGPSEETSRTKFDRTHVIGYVVASAVALFGLMTGGILYFQGQPPFVVLAAFMTFLLISAPIFIYLGLTQETRQHYGMNRRRAFSYSLATEILLFGIMATGIVYLQGQPLFIPISTLMPFLLVSAVIFIYLGLTEKSRRKRLSEMEAAWAKQWVEYYSNPQTAVMRGSLSGALWIFSFAAFFLVALTWGWKYSWIVFVVAVGLEVLLDAFFAPKKDQ